MTDTSRSLHKHREQDGHRWDGFKQPSITRGEIPNSTLRYVPKWLRQVTTYQSRSR